MVKILAAPVGRAVVRDGGEVVTPTLTVADIEVQPLSRNQWRLCDRRLPGDDARGLLGFIERTQRTEKTDEIFELMTLSDGFEFFSFASLQEAITQVARYASEVTGEHQGNDLAWIH